MGVGIPRQVSGRYYLSLAHRGLRKDSFSSLQLDVFHALWEDYYGPGAAPRPPEKPPRGEREVATREAALLEFPLGMDVCRELRDKDGNISAGGRSATSTTPTGK